MKSLRKTHTKSKHGNDSNSNSNSNSKNSSIISRNANKAIFWFLFVMAQCILIRMYHDAAKNHGNSNVSRDGSSSHYSRFEQELIWQGITDGGSNAIRRGNDRSQDQKRDSNLNQDEPDGTFNGYPIYKLRNRTKSKGTSQQQQHQQQQGEDLDLYSQFHCVGETWKSPSFHRRSKTWHEQSWMYRSCQFQMLCYDTSTEDYVIYLDPHKHKPTTTMHAHAGDGRDDNTSTKNNNVPHPSEHIQKIFEKQNRQTQIEQEEVANENHARTVLNITKFKHPSFFDDTSTVFRNHTVIVDGKGETTIDDTENANHYGVSIGSMNGKWGLVEGQRLKWFPEVRWSPIPTTNDDINNGEGEYEVYTLPSSVVMITFHSLSASNPGHLVWDDFLPMYTLLDMFGFFAKNNDNNINNDGIDLLPIRYILPGDERGLWAGCDWLKEKKVACQKMLQKFGTLIGTRRSYQKYYDVDNENHANNSTTTATKMPKIPITTNKDVELKIKGEGQILPSNLNSNIIDDGNAAGRHVPPSQFLQTIAVAGSSGTGSGSGTADDTGEKTANRARRRLATSNSKQQGQSSSSSSRSKSKKKMICSKNGLAGFGAISDHGDGTRGHGWDQKDYHVNHNQGRAGQLWDFRNFMIRNLFSTVTSKHEQVEPYPLSLITDLSPAEPLVVLFSSFSSKTRAVSFKNEAQILRDAIAERGGSASALFGEEPGESSSSSSSKSNNIEIVVETHTFSTYTLEEQIQMASRASVFVTFCGGGAITASFLPRGGSVHIYYIETGGIEGNINTKMPARLDWDFFNNLGYLNVNWIPARRSAKRGWDVNHTDLAGYEKQADANVDLILNELRRIYRQRQLHYKKQKL